MARRTLTEMASWPSLTVEGNLITPAMISRIEQRNAKEQSPEDYNVRKGLKIREEIATAFRVGQAHFAAFAKLKDPQLEATKRFASGFLEEAFGFDDLAEASSQVALSASDRVPIVVVPPNESIDRRSPTLSVERSLSPAIALQDFLNAKEEALWGLVTNGHHLRLMRDNASLTRPAYIEADLGQIFTNEDISSFAVLWLLIHRSRFGQAATPASDCALERWRDVGASEGVAARDRLAGQVQIALKLLGSGFLEANPEFANQISSGEVNLTEWFNELLRLVYRLIFLMVAEDQGVLHPTISDDDPHQKRKRAAEGLYAQGYSLTLLRKQCFRGATWDQHHDRYEGLKVVFRALAEGREALGLPALGGLFAQDQLPHLETAKLRNRAFMEALYRLSWLADQTGMAPINWRAMETEEFGSVYESLLELQPQLGEDGKTLLFASEVSEQKGNQRKTTGSYYTPDSLVQALLKTALDPVLEKTVNEAEDPAKALLQLSVIDPACGSGHFLLAAARRIADRLARIRTGGIPSSSDLRHALREVTRHCIYGVDRNPMAVELTKVALWIETIEPGLPLGFFDAQIRCGDSLLGIFDLKALEEGIPDTAYKPLAGDDKDVAKNYQQVNKEAKSGQGRFDFAGGRGLMPAMKPVVADFSSFRELPEDTLEEIGAKVERFKKLQNQEAYARTKLAADLYVAAFVLPKTKKGGPETKELIVPTTEELWRVLTKSKVGVHVRNTATATIRSQAFHWPLEFPHVMQEGGFDVVLGNPPWERIKLQEKEFFALRDHEIANAPNKAARDCLIQRLATAEIGSPQHRLFEEFETEKRLSEALSAFVRVTAKENGRFSLTGVGDVNTYALFAELFAHLAKIRAGVIVPTGIATDATTAPFFANLVERKRLAQLVDFENSSPLFQGVHRSFKFSLLTLGRNEENAQFAFFLTDPTQLSEPERNFSLTPEDISRINPNTKTAPVFRSRYDAELTAKIYRNAPVLIEDGKGEEGNPWGITFMAMFHMSNDSGLFRTAAELEGSGFTREGTDWVQGSRRYVPLYEAKMINFYDHRSSGYGQRDGERGYRVLPETELSHHQDPGFEVEPYYWVIKTDLEHRLADRTSNQWLLGFKDVTSATNERTAIFSIIPRVAAGNTMPLMFSKKATADTVSLYASLNTLVCDYIARLKVAGLHLTFGYLKQFAVLPPTIYTEARLAFITTKVLELTYTSHSLAPFARDLGHDGPPFAWDEDRRAHLRADLDAFYARAYGLTRDELRYILDPADVKGPDYPSETFRVLKEKEIRKHGEYRTRRLVLEAWDRMEANGEFKAMEM